MRRGPRSSLLGLIALLPAVVQAAPPPEKQEATRRELQEAEEARAAQLAAQKEAAARAAQAAAEEQRLGMERVEAAARLRQAEAVTAEAASRLDDLSRRRREAEARLNARAEALQPVLPLIQRLALYPAETLLAVPAPAENRLRGVMVLHGLTRHLEADAEALRQEQAALDEATRAVRAEAPRFAAALAAQSAQAEALERQLAAARALRRQQEGASDAAARRAAHEAMRAETLRGVLAALEAQRKAEEAREKAEAERTERERRRTENAAERKRRAAEAERERRESDSARVKAATVTLAPAARGLVRGQMTPPVAGRIVRAWGEGTDAGPSTGISYQAAPAARVVAPCGGKVMFAGQFRSYGLLLIINCGSGYHAVLAGFDRLDTRVGQSVQTGEPVGVMPAWDPGDAGRRPSLYVELRRDGQPINPAPLLRAGG